MKKKNSDSTELQEIFLNEKLKIREEVKFYNTATITKEIPETKKEEIITKKIKKLPNRVFY